MTTITRREVGTALSKTFTRSESSSGGIIKAWGYFTTGYRTEQYDKNTVMIRWVVGTISHTPHAEAVAAVAAHLENKGFTVSTRHDVEDYLLVTK